MTVKTVRIMLGMLVAAGCLVAPGMARAQEMPFDLKPATTVRDVLLSYVGKRVTLQLEGAVEVEGTVTRVGDALVHVSKLTGRDFYDAVVRIDEIQAIRMRVRDR